MNSKALSRTDHDSVAVLTFERPSKLNALNYELVDAIVHALNEIEAEDNVRVIVLTGSGRAFSAGADIHEFSKDVARGADVAYRQFVRRGQGMTRRIESFPKPRDFGCQWSSLWRRLRNCGGYASVDCSPGS